MLSWRFGRGRSSWYGTLGVGHVGVDLLDLDVGLADGVLDGLGAVVAGLADDDLLDDAGGLGDDGLLGGLGDLDRPPLEGGGVGPGDGAVRPACARR